LELLKNKEISLPSPSKKEQGTPQETSAKDSSHLLSKNPFPQYGEILNISRLPTLCHDCGNPLLKLEYKDEKKVFFCKYCFQK
jgi:hypothetical protein